MSAKRLAFKAFGMPVTEWHRKLYTCHFARMKVTLDHKSALWVKFGSIGGEICVTLEVLNVTLGSLFGYLSVIPLTTVHFPKKSLGVPRT